MSDVKLQPSQTEVNEQIAGLERQFGHLAQLDGDRTSEGSAVRGTHDNMLQAAWADRADDPTARTHDTRDASVSRDAFVGRVEEAFRTFMEKGSQDEVEKDYDVAKRSRENESSSFYTSMEKGSQDEVEKDYDVAKRSLENESSS